jgi:hypothetical protein
MLPEDSKFVSGCPLADLWVEQVATIGNVKRPAGAVVRSHIFH